MATDNESRSVLVWKMLQSRRLIADASVAITRWRSGQNEATNSLLDAANEALLDAFDRLEAAEVAATKLPDDFVPDRVPMPPPQRAWLVFYDPEVSVAGPDDILHSRHPARAIDPIVWNVSKHARRGDTVFIYDRGVRAIRWVARVDGDPDSRHDERWKDPQWWSALAHAIEIGGITKERFDQRSGENVNLRGSTKYLRPDVANQLLHEASLQVQVPADFDPSERRREPAFERIRRRELPDPDAMTLPHVREVAGAVLVAEQEVEVHLLEPLLRLAGLSDRARWGRRTALGGGVSDYALKDGRGKVCCVVEVKLSLTTLDEALQQARRYAAGPKARILLADARRLLGFEPDGRTRVFEMEWRSLDEADLRTLGSFFQIRPS